MNKMLRLLRHAWPALIVLPAQAAQPGPMLSCKADAQQTCTTTGCTAQDPVTQAEIDVDLRGAKPVFCYGTACWRTGWSRLERPGPGQLTVALSGATTFNGKSEHLSLQASIAMDSRLFQASVIDGPGSIQVFTGSCACQNTATGDAACLAGVPPGGVRR